VSSAQRRQRRPQMDRTDMRNIRHPQGNRQEGNPNRIRATVRKGGGGGRSCAETRLNKHCKAMSQSQSRWRGLKDKVYATVIEAGCCQRWLSATLIERRRRERQNCKREWPGFPLGWDLRGYFGKPRSSLWERMMAPILVGISHAAPKHRNIIIIPIQ